MSAHCLSVSVVRTSNQPYPHTMHAFPSSILIAGGLADNDGNRSTTQSEFEEGLVAVLLRCGDPEDMVRRYRRNLPSKNLNVHRP